MAQVQFWNISEHKQTPGMRSRIGLPISMKAPAGLCFSAYRNTRDSKNYIRTDFSGSD